MAQAIPRISLLSGTNHELADEGSYFVAKNATFGTGLATAAAPIALDDLHPFILIKGPTTPGKRLRLDYLRFVCSAPGTAGAALRAVIRIDPVTKADPTGGSQLALVCPNSDASPTFESKIFAGPLVAVAGSGGIREVVAPLIKNAIPAIGDVYLLKFGGGDQGIGSAASLVYYGGPPIIVGQNQIRDGPTHPAVAERRVELRARNRRLGALMWALVLRA
jgi:hypothetical protein